MIHRRDFLRLAGATPLIFGLDDLFTPQDGAPAWYDAALKRMKETRRYGVVLVVPAAEEERATVAEALEALLTTDNDDIREVLGEMVFVCMTPEVAAKTVKSGKDTRILLAPDGKRVEGDTVALADLAPEKFAASFCGLLHGKDNLRLKAAAEGIRETAPDSVKKALANLGSESIDVRDEARGALEAKADTIFPLLVWARLSTTAEDVRGGIRTIIRHVMKEPSLPYGTEAKMAKVSEDSCPSCGMARAPIKLNRVLTFLTK
jgi:hypothetical protein